MNLTAPQAKPPLNFDARLAAVTDAIDKHGEYLEHYLLSLTRNHADAEDLASKLWVHVLHKFKDDQIRSLPLIRRKAYQLFVDFYRHKKRLKEDLYDVQLEEPVQHLGKEAYSSAEEVELERRFWADFPVDLSTQQREVLWLSARYGFTIQEIGERLALPTSTVGDYLKRARQRFVESVNQT